MDLDKRATYIAPPSKARLSTNLAEIDEVVEPPIYNAPPLPSILLILLFIKVLFDIFKFEFKAELITEPPLLLAELLLNVEFNISILQLSSIDPIAPPFTPILFWK